MSGEAQPHTPSPPLCAVLLNYLHESQVSELSIVDMARDTSIKAEDILFTLQYLGIIKYVNQQYVLVATPQICDAKREKLVRAGLAPPGRLLCVHRPSPPPLHSEQQGGTNL